MGFDALLHGRSDQIFRQVAGIEAEQLHLVAGAGGEGAVGRGEVHVVGEQVRGRDAIGDRQHDASVVGDTGALDHAGNGEHVVGHGEETARLCRIGGEGVHDRGVLGAVRRGDVVVLRRLVVVRVVEVPEQKLALLDVHEGGGEVDIHLLGGLHGGAVLGEQQVVHGDDEIALLAGQIGVLLIGGDGRAVAVVGRAVGQGDVELRDGAVGSAAVQRRGGMVGHVPAEQPRIVGFHVVEVLGDEAGVDAGDVEGGFRAVEEGAVDYVAMDIKNSPENYGMSVGIKNYDTAKIKRSVKYLLEDHVDYEFRTTVVREFNDKNSFYGVADLISGAKKYYLQAFKDSGDLIDETLHGLTREEMEEILPIFDGKVDKIEIRGID